MPSAQRRPLVAGNWKMNAAAPAEFTKMVEGARGLTAIDIMVCPPATLLAELAVAARGSPRGNREGGTAEKNATPARFRRENG